ncbi:MAG: ATP-dependent helicase [Bacillota bacterium]
MQYDHEAYNESFKRLNEYQRAAVTDQRRVLLVNAQVGSGKTTVLIHKLLYLHFVKKLPLQSMVVLTFTNKAAREIKERIRQLDSSIMDEDMRFFGTFHSVARTLLSSILPTERIGYRKDFTVVDNDEMQEIFDRVINENSLSLKYRNKIRKRLDKYRQGKLLYGNMKKDDDLKEFIELLKQEKTKSNIMDFDDLIDYTLELLPEPTFCPEWIIIDEFQDSDSKQLQMIELLMGDKTKVFAVGDPNQVIYTWRGGKSDIFKEFKERYNADELSLPVNYRSTATILNAAKVFMDLGGTLEGVREKGKPISIKKHHNTFNEALYIADRIKQCVADGEKFSDFAVLYRKQKNSEVFREVFEKRNLPYEIAVKKSLKDIPVMYWLVRLLKGAVNIQDKDSIIYALADSRYGTGLSAAKAKELLNRLQGKGEPQCELLMKIYGFENWCIKQQGDVTADSIYDYFDLNSLLAPTSISFGEDKKSVMQLLSSMYEFIEYRQTDVFEGIREYVDNSALYGSQIINEGIHKEQDSVKLMTLHASKGLEFKHVFISGANLGSIPLPNRKEEEEKEEQRLFFVGITRAKDSLEISYHAKPDDFGVYSVPSPFLRMIPGELIESEDFGSRASGLNQLRKEIKLNIDNKAVKPEKKEAEKSRQKVVHEKYGEGYVVSEDENNIVVDFSVYGEKTFLKMLCTLRFINE